MIKMIGKLGSWSSNEYEIYGNRVPKVKDRIKIRSKSDYRVAKWSIAIVEEINDNYIWMSLL